MGSDTTAPPAPLPLGRLAGVGLIVFWANAALLVLQLVAGRLLAPFVGSSLETWTSIIGVFLTGIALGNALGGKLADRYPSPRTLAFLLAAGAAAALWMVAFPQFLAATGKYKAIPLGPRIPVLTLALCLPAGFALSLLTPLAIRLGLPDVSRTGRVAGLIFALSTLGCLLGNYLTGFVLIPLFTVNTLVYAAAAVLVVLSAGTFLLLRETPAEAAAVATPVADAPGSPSASPHAFTNIRRAYLVVFLASFGGMTLELTASRVLAQYLGVSLFTWTGIIGVMLAGTALGNLTGGFVADRARAPLAVVIGAAAGFVTAAVPLAVYAPRVTGWLSAPVLGAVAAGAAVGFVAWRVVARVEAGEVNPRKVLAGTLIAAGAGTVFQFVALVFVQRLAPFAGLHPIAQVMGWTFSLFFLPMFVLGMVSPQVIRLSVPDVAHAGRVAGRVYAWSTAGAIAGTFAAGYVLLSTLGANNTLLAVSVLLTLAAALVTSVWDDNALLYLLSVVLGGVTGGFILKYRAGGDESLVALRETNYYTIKVVRVADEFGRPTDVLQLNLDYLIHSRVDPTNPGYLYYTHEHVQMEFLRQARAQNPEPRVLVIGGGGYTFPRYAMTMLPETKMDVVEIDPGVTAVAREHLGLKDYPGLRPIHMDGRQFVAERAARGGYDLVAQDAVNDLSVPAHLLTREYNAAIKAALAEDGVYLLTVIDSLQHGKLWRAAMRTLRETFPHVELVTPDEPPAEPAAFARRAEAGAAVLPLAAAFTPAAGFPLPPDAVAAAMASAAKDHKARLAKWKTTRQVLIIYASDRPLDPDRFRAVVTQQVASDPRADDTGFFTRVIPADRLAPFLAADPGVLLTDQYAPVDNLMAEVFRYREKDRPRDAADDD